MVQILQEFLILGYKYMFNDQLVTVWSAPNYCYRCGNVASILEFMDVDNRTPKLFDAVPDSDRIIPTKAATPYFLWSDQTPQRPPTATEFIGLSRA